MSTSNSVDDSGRRRWVILAGLGVLALLVSLFLANCDRSGTNTEPPRQTGTPSSATAAVQTGASTTVPTVASTAPPPSTTG